MSARSIYFRDQADKLRWHADHLTDAETKEQLRKLAREYIERAARAEAEAKAKAKAKE
jgi:Uri superfamily endonuclease